MISGDMEPIRQVAIKQVEAGADILIISIAAFGIDESATLPRITEEVINTADAFLLVVRVLPYHNLLRNVRLSLNQYTLDEHGTG